MELPYELQQIIFEYAARLDRRCACSLLLVASHVNEWILPILYEDVRLKNEVDASHFVQIKRNYLLQQSVPKFLTLGPYVPLGIAKELLLHLSRSIITLTISRNSINAAHLLPFIESPLIRRISLISDIFYDPSEEFPYTLLPSITHLAIVSDNMNSGVSFHRCVKIAEALRTNDKHSLALLNLPMSTINPFINLTRLAITISPFEVPSISIKNYTPQLKCFAVLLPRYHNFLFGVKYFVAQMRLWEDPRLVIVRQFGGHDWIQSEGFWTTVENLVSCKCICDDGEKWDESVVTQFRLNHPHISLLA